MSFESCPTCGYALSMVDHQCRHCRGTFKAGPTGGKKLDLVFMTRALLVAAISICLCRFFIFR